MKFTLKHSEEYNLYGIKGYIEWGLLKILDKIKIHIDTNILFTKEINALSLDNLHEDIREVHFNDFTKQYPLNPLWFDSQKRKNITWGLLFGKNRSYGIFDNDLLIAYGFADFIRFNRLNVMLKESDVYFWDDYTHPDYRGKRLHEQVMKARLQAAKERGKTRALTIVSTYNRASIRAHEREGFKRIQTFIIFRIWKFRYCSFKYPE